MIASIASILAVGAQLVSAATVLVKAGKDAAPLLTDLKRLFSGEKITEAELAEIRARSDAVNAEIEALPDQD